VTDLIGCGRRAHPKRGIQVLLFPEVHMHEWLSVERMLLWETELASLYVAVFNNSVWALTPECGGAGEGWTLDAALEELRAEARAGAAFLAAREEGRMVGFAVLLPATRHRDAGILEAHGVPVQTSWWLSDVGVALERRRAGIGLKLHLTVHKSGLARGFRHIAARTRSTCEEHHVLLGLGYRIVGSAEFVTGGKASERNIYLRDL